MSAQGLGRVKTPLREMSISILGAEVSGYDRRDQRLDPDDVHNPGQIIGKD